MTLHPDGREYYTWPVTTDAVPAPSIQLSLDGEDWANTVPVDGGIRALVAGPDATGNPDDTIVLTLGVNRFLARAVDNPEIVIRTAGEIRCGTL